MLERKLELPEIFTDWFPFKTGYKTGEPNEEIYYSQLSPSDHFS